MRQIPNKSKSSKGFTLIEVVIVLLLTGIMLGMVAQLVSKTLESTRFLQEKSQTLQSASLGLERLASEMREMVAPPSFGPLSFVKVNPGASEGVGNDPNNFLIQADAWAKDYAVHATAGNQLATITYDAGNPNNHLIRTVNFSGTSSSTVATSVNTFTVTRPYGVQNAFRVTLSLREQRRIVTFVTNVVAPGVNP